MATRPLRNGRPLPPSQVVHTTPRGAGAPQITIANVPPINIRTFCVHQCNKRACAFQLPKADFKQLDVKFSPSSFRQARLTQAIL
jgi:hypothetical protein